MKKRILLALLAVVCTFCCALAFVACDNDDGDGDGGTTPTVAVENITLDRNELTLAVDGEDTLIPTVTPADATNKAVTWTVSPEGIVTVNNSGKVTAVAAGTATVTVTAGGKSADCEVTVTPPIEVESIAIAPDSATLTVSDSITLSVTHTPANATIRSVTWTVSPEGIVTVNNSGKVTAIAAGTATVTATTGGKSADCEVTVKQPTQGLKYRKMVTSTGYSYYVEKLDAATDTDIVIPPVYDDSPVVGIGGGAFQNCSSITSVTIPGSITYISSNAFSGCTSLTSVYIPNSVTSIGEGAFKGCTSLSSINVPNSVTTIGDSAFDDCNSLQYNEYENAFYLGNSDNPYYVLVKAKDTDITVCTVNENTKFICSPAFVDCGSLSSITIPNSVTTICESAFQNCSSLTSITIPNGVTTIGGSAFSGCTSLSSITIPNGVTTIGWSMFGNCTSLSSITIPNGVTTIGGSAFSGCTSLSSITIPNGVMTIGGSAFSGCTSLSSITIPNSVTQINYGTFWSCHSLETVTISNNATSIGERAFYDCTALLSITIPNSVITIGEDAFGGCTSLATVTMSSGVTTIADFAFRSCSSLISITIPDSVTTIAATAFDDCTSLTEVNFPAGFDANSIAFTGCTKYKGTLVGNYYLLGSKLTSVTAEVTTAIIPSTVTAIAANAFEAATALKYVYVPSSVTTIESGAFTGCENAAVFFGGSAKNYSPVTSIYQNVGFCTADGWIYGNSGSGVAIRAYIGNGGEVTVPAKIDGKDVISISNQVVGYAFLQRDDITKITISSKIMTVDGSVFGNLTNLTEIAVTADVTQLTMSKAAFEGCTSLTTISLAGGYANYQIAMVTFTSEGQPSGSETVDVTDGADVLAKLNGAGNLTVCAIVAKDQAV